MPQPQHRYNSEVDAILQRVFEGAWEELRNIHPLTAQPGNVKEARDELAKRICEIYEGGEREPETIKLLAISAFNRWVGKM